MKSRNNKILMTITMIFFIMYSLALIAYKINASDTTDSIAIIGFHNIVSEKDKQLYHKNNMWVDSVDEFEKKMKFLYEQGYTSLSLDELYNWYKGEIEIPEKSIVITFDDGYYASSFLIPEILAKYDFVGTTFVVGSSLEMEHEWDGSTIQFMNVDDMKDQSIMKYYSHTYGLHGKDQGEFLIEKSNENEIEQDFELQKAFVDNTYLAYPYGYYNDKIISVLPTKGVKLAFGYNENRKAKKTDNIYTIPRFAITSYTNMETFKAMLGE